MKRVEWKETVIVKKNIDKYTEGKETRVKSKQNVKKRGKNKNGHKQRGKFIFQIRNRNTFTK
jgi:hypothetical protein